MYPVSSPIQAADAPMSEATTGVIPNVAGAMITAKTAPTGSIMVAFEARQNRNSPGARRFLKFSGSERVSRKTTITTVRVTAITSRPIIQ